MEHLIKLAVRFGWRNSKDIDVEHVILTDPEIFFDKEFWKAISRAKKWQGIKCYPCGGHHDVSDLWVDEGNPCSKHVAMRFYEIVYHYGLDVAIDLLQQTMSKKSDSLIT